MASTYSNNLKIQLMTTGENNTTWGAVTNTNLGTALEEAIVGSADITLSDANATLTLTNTNSSQAARNLRLNVVGSTGGVARNITVPDVEKIYIVNNTCADSVAIANSTGANVSVPAGKTMWVYSTGAGVVSPVSHVPALSVGTTPSPVVSENATQTLTNKTIEGANLGANTFATTLSTGDNSTKVATTAFVSAELAALPDMSRQTSSNVSITGGSIAGVTVDGEVIGTNAAGNRIISADDPTGGEDGDIWYQI